MLAYKIRKRLRRKAIKPRSWTFRDIEERVRVSLLDSILKTEVCLQPSLLSDIFMASSCPPEVETYGIIEGPILSLSQKSLSLTAKSLSSGFKSCLFSFLRSVTCGKFLNHPVPL